MHDSKRGETDITEAYRLRSLDCLIAVIGPIQILILRYSPVYMADPDSLPLSTSPHKVLGDFQPSLNLDLPQSLPLSPRKEPIIRLQGEDLRESAKLFRRLCTAEVTCAMLGVVGFGCFAIGEDLQYTNGIFERKETECAIALYIGTISTLLLLVAIGWRSVLEFRWQQARCVYSLQDSFLSVRKYRMMLVEWLVVLPHPVIWLQGLTFSYTLVLKASESHGVGIEYPINALLCIWSLLRQYLLIKVIFTLSKYCSPRAQRVCRMNGGSASKLFALRCMMQGSPYAIVGLFLLLGVLSGAFSIRIFERPAREYTGMDFSSYANAIWYCLITIATVGYGDYYAVTLPGRVIAFLVCLWGLVTVAVMILFVARLLKFGSGEENAVAILHRLEFKTELRTAAANVLSTGLRYCLRAKLHPNTLPNSSHLIGKFRRFVHEFEKMRVSQRKLYNQDTWEEQMQKKVRMLAEENRAMQEELADLHRIVRNLRDTLMIQSTNEGVREG